VTYVAGDRVVTDLLCKPFSMGKNLLCVHSKKHMDDDPSQKSAKMKQNLNTVKAMQRLLKKGGLLIWIAPAGGRDRRDANGQITPGNWDPAAVEMMRKLGTKKGMTKTHYYPLGEFIFGYFWLFFGYFWLFFGYFWLCSYVQLV
jgi:glycerol-3-phosphate O-acyltransferase